MLWLELCMDRLTNITATLAAQKKLFDRWTIQNPPCFRAALPPDE
jgi:hypothetical protein